MSSIKTCAVLGKFDQPNVAESARALVPFLTQRGLTVLVEERARHQGLGGDVSPVGDEEMVARAELAIVIGGDGSLLYAARLIGASGIPLLGINRGRLGFLTDTMPQDMLACVTAALEGRCLPDHRPLLEARLIDADGAVRQQLALNDVVL